MQAMDLKVFLCFCLAMLATNVLIQYKVGKSVRRVKLKK
jgi:hypothetical protein